MATLAKLIRYGTLDPETKWLNVNGCASCQQPIKDDNRVYRLGCAHLIHETCMPSLKCMPICPSPYCGYQLSPQKKGK